MKTISILLGGALLALAFGVAPVQARLSAVNVTITTPDDVALAGSYWGQPGRAPSVLLLHMLGQSREDWNGLAEALSGAGFSVLAIDFRGHGQSTRQGGRSISFTDFSERDWKGLVTDVGAALDWMASQPGVDPARIGVVGASIGANAALIDAAQDKRVRTLVLLSPGYDYHGLKTEHAMETFGTRSVFLVASEDDDLSSVTIKRLGSLARGRSAVKLFKKAGHGTRMLDAEPTLQAQILGWLKENLQ